jgi:mycoredoxin
MNGPAAPALVTVYWRPGCPYCTRLRAGLRRAGLPAREVNIWQDDQARARVRSLAGGNETVPTVVVGERAMVNPSPRSVIAAALCANPALAADTRLRAATQRRHVVPAAQWITVAAVVAGSVAADTMNHPGLGWILVGLAVATYLIFRLLRQ